MKEVVMTVEEQDAHLAAHTENLRLQNERKRTQLEQLEVLVAQRRALLDKMRAAVLELDEENARIERDVERVLTRAT